MDVAAELARAEDLYLVGADDDAAQVVDRLVAALPCSGPPSAFQVARTHQWHAVAAVDDATRLARARRAVHALRDLPAPAALLRADRDRHRRLSTALEAARDPLGAAGEVVVRGTVWWNGQRLAAGDRREVPAGEHLVQALGRRGVVGRTGTLAAGDRIAVGRSSPPAWRIALGVTGGALAVAGIAAALAAPRGGPCINAVLSGFDFDGDFVPDPACKQSADPTPFFAAGATLALAGTGLSLAAAVAPDRRSTVAVSGRF